MRVKVPTMQMPPDVFCQKRKLKDGSTVEYWYHQTRRNSKEFRSKLTRLPAPNTKEWFATLAKLQDDVPTVKGSVFDAWLAYKSGPWFPKKKASIYAYTKSWKNHIKPIFGDENIAGIKTHHLSAWRDSYADMPQTFNLALATFSQIMTRAVESGLRQDNPCKEIKRLVVTPDEAKPLTDAAWQALISPQAPEALQRLAVLGRATGQRISDLMKMRPVDRDGTGIRADIKKISKDRFWITLTPEQAKTIDSWSGFPTRPYLLVGKTRSLESNLREAWGRFKADTPALKGFTFHDLRATCVCDDRLLGLNELEISIRRGLSPEMVKKYSKHIDQKKASEATEKVKNSA